jgi:hypothetical protein
MALGVFAREEFERKKISSSCDRWIDTPRFFFSYLELSAQEHRTSQPRLPFSATEANSGTRHWRTKVRLAAFA